ncbi:MAG: GAF domain-containing protein, partial [Candidatus Dormibacteria bacterium]
MDRCRGGTSDGGGRIATGITVGWEDQGRLAGRELEDVCRYALELLGAQRVSVWRQMLAADIISLYAVARADGKDEPAELRERWSYVPLSDLPVIAQSLRDGQPVEISDATTEAGRMPQFSADFGVRSLRCEPLLRGGESLGALTVEPAEVATGDQLAVRTLVGAASASLGLLQADQRRAELELFLQLGEAAGSASIGEILALG